MDAGGVRKEFFLLLLKELMDPVYGMFTHYKESNLLWFSDKVGRVGCRVFMSRNEINHKYKVSLGFYLSLCSKRSSSQFHPVFTSFLCVSAVLCRAELVSPDRDHLRSGHLQLHSGRPPFPTGPL